MNNIPLLLYRPKLKNILESIIFAIIGSLNIVAVILISNVKEYAAFWDKLINTVGFCSMLIMALFMAFSFFNAVRNIFSPPTVVLDNNKLQIFSQKDVSIKDISETKLIKEKKKVVLKVIKKNKEEIEIKQGLISVPLNTLEYAIHIRLDQINKK